MKIYSGDLMNATSTHQVFEAIPRFPSSSAKGRFRERFQRSLRSCLRRGFSVEECFGMIWVETWEEIALSEQGQSELYDELIGWAKRCTL
jgi:hypothetical protein